MPLKKTSKIFIKPVPKASTPGTGLSLSPHIEHTVLSVLLQSCYNVLFSLPQNCCNAPSSLRSKFYSTPSAPLPYKGNILSGPASAVPAFPFLHGRFPYVRSYKPHQLQREYIGKVPLW